MTTSTQLTAHPAAIDNGAAQSKASSEPAIGAKRRPMASFTPPPAPSQRHSQRNRAPFTPPRDITATASKSKIPIVRDAGTAIALPARGFLP